MNKISQLHEFLNESPNDSFLLYALALEYIKGNEVEKAINIFEQLVKSDEQYLATYLQYGNLLGQLGNLKMAEEILNKGVEIANQQNNIKTRQELEQAIYLLD
jgi:predicted Zn-dependent protease